MFTIVVSSSLGRMTCGTGNDESMLKRERERGREGVREREREREREKYIYDDCIDQEHDLKEVNLHVLNRKRSFQVNRNREINQ